MILTPVVGIPVACVVAVLKDRLYDIDRIISRTVSYAVVTGLLVGLYAGLVLLAGHVLPVHSSIAVAGATLVVAALFSPVRRRVQHVVDHRFNRTRYDAELMTAAFVRLEADPDPVRVRAGWPVMPISAPWPPPASPKPVEPLSWPEVAA
jgi:hypothetical protein